MLMKLRILWERCGARHWALTAAPHVPDQARMPTGFQALTREEFTALLNNAIRWLLDETRAVRAMPNGPCKERRWAELRARDRSMARDFERLVRERQALRPWTLTGSNPALTKRG